LKYLFISHLNTKVLYQGYKGQIRDRVLFMIFNWLDLRKIDTAFAIFAAALFRKQIPVNHPANIKQGSYK